jgi:alkylation response protein AidB-like acyl-CoA dehydrogenase
MLLNRRAAQMYVMGTLLRHGSEEKKQRYLPKIAEHVLGLPRS